MTVRSNPSDWYWDTMAPQTFATKFFRTADAYVPIGTKSYSLESIKLAIPSCQPWSSIFKAATQSGIYKCFKIESYQK